MLFAVIGLGRFGFKLATTLAEKGADEKAVHSVAVRAPMT
jgi:Trk K+ transport system NAD-binding subunit